MAQIYLDQNALIGLGAKARSQAFRKKLDELVESGIFNAVVSPWHLIETAHTKNLDNAVELAEFIDSLKPAWLLERRDIQRLEVQEDFYRFLKFDFEIAPRVTTRSAAFATLLGRKDTARFDIPSPNFVKQWIERPEQTRTLEKSYQNSAVSLTRLRELVKEGKVTDEIRKRVDDLLVESSLPKSTPAGLYVGRETEREYVVQVRVETIPSLAIETAISEHEWVSQGGADRNTLIDKFHLISALPYMDEIVSDDKFFHKVYEAAQKTGYVKAQLVGNDGFLKRF